ncbi:MAG: hypothetical protein EOP86_27525, partial [Verrucomicrobiaceae bacterium]
MRSAKEVTASLGGLGQQLVVSRRSLLENSTLTLQGGTGLAAHHSELRNVRLIAGTGSIQATRSLLADFSLSTSGGGKEAGAAGIPRSLSMEMGPRLILQECLISGKLELPQGRLAGFLSLDKNHFVRAVLAPAEKGAAEAGPGASLMSIRNSHFEKCELPLSVVLRTKGCTFEDCGFEDDLPASAAPEGFTVSVVSRAPQNDPVLAKRRIGVKQVTEPAFRFWSPWTEDAAGAVTTGHRIA